MPSMLSFVLPFFSVELVVRQRLGQKPTTLPPLKIHHRGEISRSSRPSRLVRLVTLKILLEDDCQRLSVGALAWHGVTALSRLSELRSLGKSALVTMSRLSRSIFPLPGGNSAGATRGPSTSHPTFVEIFVATFVGSGFQLSRLKEPKRG